MYRTCFSVRDFDFNVAKNVSMVQFLHLEIYLDGYFDGKIEAGGVLEIRC